MLGSIRHRGPDDSGHAYFDTRKRQQGDNHDLCLSHSRLSILDLSSKGHQPMFSRSGDICLVFNGEIFNYLELRKELEDKGHVFVTKTDTEVIMAAYEEWGESCLNRFNGMWSFVIYDQKKNIIFCSRDRFGIKPFYYYLDDDFFVFGSEMKSIFRFPIPSLTINEEKLMLQLVQGYRYNDGEQYTFFQEIKQLQPAEFMIFDLSERKQKKETFWKLDLQSKFPKHMPKEELISEFRRLLLDSVRIRLRSDVPYTFTLSGGMDSASVVSISKKVFGKEVITFSAVYEKGNRYDEQEYIEATIDDLKNEHYFIKPRLGDFFSNLDEMIRYHDEPICTVTYYSHWQVMQKIKEQGFKVILSGLAADESLTGYYYYFPYYFLDLLHSGQPGSLKREVDAWLSVHKRRPEEWEEFQKDPDTSRLLFPKKDSYRRLLRKGFLERFKGKEEVRFCDSALTNRMYNELRIEGVPVLVKSEDRNSMRFSLESRTPFLDYRLVEFCYRLPNSLKIRNGISKYIFREAMSGILNDKVRMRTEKVGFNAPFYEWMKNELRQEIEKMLDDPGMRIYHYIDQKVVLDFFQEHMQGDDNHMMLFWNILNVEFWLRYVEDIKKGLKRAQDVFCPVFSKKS
jgi:asparagine synthase (glutamine-hydrolysing)